MPQVSLASFLHQVALEIERGASPEGTVQWSAPVGEATYTVAAVVRCGSDDGRGGLWLVGEMDEGPIPPEVIHATDDPEPPITTEATEQRLSDIESRLRTDIAREWPVLDEAAMDSLVSHAMFQVEHLLAELESKG